MSQIIVPGDPLETLKRCGGVYDCPRKLRGPLVGYTSEYEASDGTMKQWVGYDYAHLAKAEEHPGVLQHFAREFLNVLAGSFTDDFDFLCGVPVGGYTFSQVLESLMPGKRAIRAEKKVVAPATKTMLEQSELVYRFEIGARCVVVEEVCHNFSTTDEVVRLISRAGGKVVAIFCFLNRSPVVENEYCSLVLRRGVPVISLVRRPMPEYRQEDPEVKNIVDAGNVVFDPRADWARLMREMEAP
jgi:orotate phosphoribosyltransferase